uniref:Uncharacterized protein n=1 Tax=Globodera pallida TaxID=36090 RepID=A0A183BWI8_GLOPA
MANPMKNNAMLREARSSPFIGSNTQADAAAGPLQTRLHRRRPDSSESNNRLQNAASAEHFEQMKELVQFSAGSSSSTSLTAGIHFGMEQSVENYLRIKAESVDNLSDVSGCPPLVHGAHPSEADIRASITSMAATAGSMSPTLMETTNLRSAAKQHCSETNLHVREDFVGLRDNGFKILGEHFLRHSITEAGQSRLRASCVSPVASQYKKGHSRPIHS